MAVVSGAREEAACELVGISVRTLQRWRGEGLEDRRKGSPKRTPRKLPSGVVEAEYRTANLERFADQTPEQVVATLAGESTYLASASTVYRVLRARNAVNRRQDSKTPVRNNQPEQRIATAPNQVWTWDITWLTTEVKGIWFYAYVIMDIFDRSVVGWSIHDSEDGEHARELFERTCRDQAARPSFVHSDNGAPMKASTLVNFLYANHILPTTNRPRVSNDNPFSESLFKTVKYRAGYPRTFKTLMAAMTWFAGFVDWYNTQHLHSALAYLTPEQCRTGKAAEVLERRNQTLAAARVTHPLRWGKRKAKVYATPTETVLHRRPAA
jgi:transposase InsO family protein